MKRAMTLREAARQFDLFAAPPPAGANLLLASREMVLPVLETLLQEALTPEAPVGPEGDGHDQ